MSARGRTRWTTSVAAAAAGVSLAIVSLVAACSDDDAGGAPDASSDGTPNVTDGTVYEAIPTGDVKGSIAYAGTKRGTVVIGFLSHIPGAPGSPPGPPKVGGFALATPASFPGTYSTKIPPGTWVVTAYMTTGQPPKLDGPRLSEAGVPVEPVDPRQPPPSVVVEVDKTSTADIVLIDIPDGPPPGDAGLDGDDADQ